jgi:hypothetical protein
MMPFRHGAPCCAPSPSCGATTTQRCSGSDLRHSQARRASHRLGNALKIRGSWSSGPDALRTHRLRIISSTEAARSGFA